MKALDLFCGAGGASMGIHRAGFEVTGVDIRPQPRYPFTFIQGDAMTVPLEGIDFVWASPPCQAYSRTAKLVDAQHGPKERADLVEPVRARLKAWGGPYIIENVEGAPLDNPARLCGSSFGLLCQRHRLFESNFLLMDLPCEHWRQSYDKPALHRLTGRSRVVGCYGNGRGKGDNVALWKKALGIDWMTRKEMAQAIPPAYSQFLAEQIVRFIR